MDGRKKEVFSFLYSTDGKSRYRKMKSLAQGSETKPRTKFRPPEAWLHALNTTPSFLLCSMSMLKQKKKLNQKSIEEFKMNIIISDGDKSKYQIRSSPFA